MRTLDRLTKGTLAAVFFGALALILWPVYVALHRNEQERVVLERWER